MPVTDENAGWRLHVRVERETLTRLPRTRAILFTIRTYVHRLDRYGRDPARVRPCPRWTEGSCYGARPGTPAQRTSHQAGRARQGPRPVCHAHPAAVAEMWHAHLAESCAAG